MLVLSRKVKESIQIGAATCVRILDVRGRRVWIGIDAPREVRVVRGELAEDRQDDPPAADAGCTVSVSR